jgi:hypothetical protein
MQKTTSLIIIGILMIAIAGFRCTTTGDESKPEETATTQSQSVDFEKIWHVKAFLPTGQLLDVKALDKDGNIYDVKAFQKNGNVHMMDIKAIVAGRKLPVKMLVSNDQYAPVKAIGEDGTIYDIKAITREKDRLDVKGVNRSGNIIQMKAITKSGEFLGIKALSQTGQLYDIKGIKMSENRVEGNVNGVDFHAHIKALPQIGHDETDSVWHVTAIHPNGIVLGVYAFDSLDNLYDVKAFPADGELHLMDIKAYINGSKKPVKMLVSEDNYAPVKAIGDDGKIYDIKALTAEGEKLDVKGIKPYGNIIQIKAIGKDGTFYGVKAISPHGNLHDVKGVKMVEDRVEMLLNGVEVYAHVKALPAVIDVDR